MRSRKLLPSVAIGATATLLAIIAFATASPAFSDATTDTASTASDSKHAADPIPRDDWELPEEGEWLRSEEMSSEVLVAFDEVDKALDYPSETSRNNVLTLAKSAAFDNDGLYEGGAQYQFILDSWECEWVAAARDAADAGNTEGVVVAGQNLMQRIDFPGQKELLPDWDITVAGDISPLLAGDYESVREFWDFQCFAPPGDELEWEE